MKEEEPQLSQTSFMVPKASKYSNNAKIKPRCDSSITLYCVGLLFHEDLNLHRKENDLKLKASKGYGQSPLSEEKVNRFLEVL